MAQVALAWSLAKDFVTAPIIGSTSLKNLEDLIGTLLYPRLFVYLSNANWSYFTQCSWSPR